MQRIFAVVYLITSLLSFEAFSQIENILQFKGQKVETVDVDKVLELIRPVPVQVPSTCTRDVPYESYECQEVPRTRQECSTVPDREDCWNENERQCRTVTRTRNECQRGPSQRVCRDLPPRQVCTERPSQRVCRTVTRTREECSTGPSRQVCTNNPPRRVCRQNPSREECRMETRTREECSTGAGRQVCTNRPTREVCTERNGRRTCSQVGGGQDCRTLPGERSCRQVPHQERVCRTVGGGETCSDVGGGQTCSTVPGQRTCRNVPYQDQECSTVGGGQTCSTVPGGQDCQNIPGPEICQTIPYQDQECWDEPRRQCRTIPSHEECRDILYTENVCGNVTRTRSESYACMKTELQNKPVQKRVQGKINFEFITALQNLEFSLKNLLTPNSKDGFDHSLLLNGTEPKALVIVQEKDLKVLSETQDAITLDGSVKIKMIDPKDIQAKIPSSITDAVFDYENDVLTITFAGEISNKGSIELELTQVWRRRVYTVARLATSFPNTKLKIEGKKLIINLADEMTEEGSEGMTLSLSLKTEGQLEATILNSVKPQVKAEKVYDDLEVKLE